MKLTYTSYKTSKVKTVHSKSDEETKTLERKTTDKHRESVLRRLKFSDGGGQCPYQHGWEDWEYPTRQDIRDHL